MIDNNNILLITDNEEIAKSVTKKLVLLRSSDNITVIPTNNYKKAIENSIYSVIILHETEDNEYTLKLISNIKETKPDAEILLLLNDTNKDLILKAYDIGIFDYFLYDTEDYELLIKTINCFKLRKQKDINSRNEKFLYQLGVIDPKTNIYQYKYLKDIFIDISEDLKIQNGFIAVVTMNENIRTKVSTNRLSCAIKASVRGDDIIASARGGKFYIILPNITLSGTQELINKIQQKMGEDYKIHAGLARIGNRSFETIDKNAQDSLISATQDEVLTVCLEENPLLEDSWTNNEEENTKKCYKLFNTAFTNKMQNVITPAFYRYQKEYENKLTNTKVSHYTNNIECVFCLKNKSLQSELTIRYNGYAKFKIEITHSGLDSAENTKIEVPLSSLTDKFLSSLLKQLKNEYKQCAYKEGE